MFTSSSGLFSQGGCGIVRANMIYGLGSVQFYFFALLAALALFSSWYLPGSVLMRQLKWNSGILHVLLSVVTGLVLWTTQGFLLSWLHLRWLTYIYLAVFIFFAIKQRVFEQHIWNRLKQEFRRANRFGALLICLGVFVQMLAIFPSGLRTSTNGVGYFNTNPVDGVMHLAYIEELKQNFPPHEPGAAQLELVNYHFWSDLSYAELSRVWQIPANHLFFQFVPPLISLLTAIAAYLVIRSWGGSRVAGNWGIFLLCFAGDGAYIILWLLHQRLGFDTPAIDHGISQFLNMPHTFAKLIFLTSLLPLHIWVKDRQRAVGILAIFLMISLVGFKIYFGLFAALGLVCMTTMLMILTFWKELKETSIVAAIKQTLANNIDQILLVGIFASVAAAIYLPTNHGAGGLFFSPLEWPKLFLSRDNLDWNTWWLRRQLYESLHKQLQLTVVDGLAMAICLVSVYGTRMIGAFPPASLRRRLPIEYLAFFWPGIIVFTWLGLFTLQHSGLFNVFNFFVVAVTVMALWAAFPLAGLWESGKKHWQGLALLIGVLSVPHALYDGGRYLINAVTGHYDYVFTSDDMAALNYLKTQTPKSSVVQSHPGNQMDTLTPYVAAFSGRRTFLTGGGLMETHAQPIKPIKLELASIFENAHDAAALARQLQSHHIDYFYLHQNSADEQFKYPLPEQFMKIVYKNDTVEILQPVVPEVSPNTLQ